MEGRGCVSRFLEGKGMAVVVIRENLENLGIVLFLPGPTKKTVPIAAGTRLRSSPTGSLWLHRLLRLLVGCFSVAGPLRVAVRY